MTIDYLNNTLVENPYGGKDLTLKEYLKETLLTFIREGESFSGKRPFGNSDWDWQIYKGLIALDNSLGTLDEDGYIATVDSEACDRIIVKCVKEVFK